MNRTTRTLCSSFTGRIYAINNSIDLGNLSNWIQSDVVIPHGIYDRVLV